MDTLETLLAKCRDLTECGEPADDLLQATGDFLRDLSPNGAMPQGAIDALPTLPPAGASWLAIVFGSAIEGGAAPERTGQAVVALLREWLDALPHPTDEDEDLPELNAAQSELAEALPQLCQAAVAHLARMTELRQELAADDGLMHRLELAQDYSYGLMWVKELLSRRSGPLIALHPPSRRALQLRYENVANCFHLFTLMQVAIGETLPGGNRPDPNLAAAARGEIEVDRDTNDFAWWHFGDPRSPEPNFVASIFGEAAVSTIPEYDGVQIIVLWPPILGHRGWDGGFFGPGIEAAPANVVIERELTEEEAASWFDKLGIA